MKLAANEILVLRDVKKNMKSWGEFVWPIRGWVEAHDWQDTDKCGHGLHGLPWGAGGNYFIGGPDAKWLVVRVNTDDGYRHGTGELQDKCKFRRGHVEFCGSRDDAVSIIVQYAPPNTPIRWAVQVTNKDGSIQTAGIEAIQTGGYEVYSDSGGWVYSDSGGWVYSDSGGWVYSDSGGWVYSDSGGWVYSDSGGRFCPNTVLVLV